MFYVQWICTNQGFFMELTEWHSNWERNLSLNPGFSGGLTITLTTQLRTALVKMTPKTALFGK